MRVGWALGAYYTFTWAGQPLLQLPEDVVRLQEVLFEIQPEVIVETGVCGGGSLLLHATICEAIGKGRVIGIDVQIPESTRAAVSNHRLGHRIAMIEADSAAPSTIAQVRDLVGSASPILVILDSDHSRAHVAHELEAYAPLVTTGSCMVVEDGVMRDLTDVPGGHVEWAHDNPATAAREFLAAHPEFEMREPSWKHNRSELRRNITYWPDAWLWRIR
ncbi:MAG: class I SAM-dependent methyltransferase [Acidobacteriota bacterium]|nr:class I SAM-dependent methyltransferase [Acidobacteriota bacterium]